MLSEGDVWGGRGSQGLLRGLRGGLRACLVIVQDLIVGALCVPC